MPNEQPQAAPQPPQSGPSGESGESGDAGERGERLDARGIAPLLGRSPRTAAELIQPGGPAQRIPSWREGGRVYALRRDVEAYRRNRDALHAPPAERPLDPEAALDLPEAAQRALREDLAGVAVGVWPPRPLPPRPRRRPPLPRLLEGEPTPTLAQLAGVVAGDGGPETQARVVDALQDIWGYLNVLPGSVAVLLLLSFRGLLRKAHRDLEQAVPGLIAASSLLLAAGGAGG
jgi:hypothetical protein